MHFLRGVIIVLMIRTHEMVIVTIPLLDIVLLACSSQSLSFDYEIVPSCAHRISPLGPRGSCPGVK